VDLTRKGTFGGLEMRCVLSPSVTQVYHGAAGLQVSLWQTQGCLRWKSSDRAEDDGGLAAEILLGLVNSVGLLRRPKQLQTQKILSQTSLVLRRERRQRETGP
jgi:hypothetical protein